jgi:hypothetical protein
MKKDSLNVETLATKERLYLPDDDTTWILIHTAVRTYDLTSDAVYLPLPIKNKKHWPIL